MPAVIRSWTQGIGPNTATWQVNAPTGVTAGMSLLAFLSVDGGGVANITGGGTWQQIGHIAGTPGVLTAVDVWWRLGTNAEPSQYTVNQAGTADGVCVVVAIAGAVTTQPQVGLGNAFTNSQAAISPSIVPATSSGLEFRFAAGTPSNVAVSWSTPVGFDELADIQSEDDVSGQVVWRRVSSTTATGQQFHLANASLLCLAALVVVVESSTAQVPDPPVVQPFTPGRGTSRYRYVVTRLLDRTYLGDLDLKGVSFDKRILQAGSFSATIPIPNRRVRSQVADIIPLDDTVLDRGPGVITVQIYRDGDPWGEYWITAATIGRSRRGTPAVQLRGSTLDAYLSHVEIQNDLFYTNTDQIDIARALLNHAQAQAGANIGLALQSGTSGVKRDRTYLDSEGGTYGQRLVELAQVDNGFEWAIDLALVSGVLERQWRWGYPTLGQAEPQHVLVDSAHGGDILEWSEEIDALRGATRWRARGSSISTDASTSATPLVSTVASATAHLAAGWPRLDRTISYPTATVQATLDDYAAFWAAKAPGALRVDQVTIALGANPTLTPNSLGDTAMIKLDNEWHVRQSRIRRVIGMRVTPTSRDSGKEEAQLVLEGQEAPGA
ncbi:hypothetical protein ACIBK9_47045 [Nonomuraea sp. NPDC050227]|uniref:hypothetical protein n=1 Tax=Nonomuraea sp. NPDC050227 TaxID=3364360 RepID=UPI0037914920